MDDLTEAETALIAEWLERVPEVPGVKVTPVNHQLSPGEIERVSAFVREWEKTHKPVLVLCRVNTAGTPSTPRS
jgi:hypothetical protein